MQSGSVSSPTTKRSGIVLCQKRVNKKGKKSSTTLSPLIPFLAIVVREEIEASEFFCRRNPLVPLASGVWRQGELRFVSGVWIFPSSLLGFRVPRRRLLHINVVISTGIDVELVGFCGLFVHLLALV